MAAAGSPMRIETTISLILGGVALILVLTLAIVHPRSEVLSINLNTGETRLERYVYGFPYSRETITSYLEWVQASKGDTGERWMPTSERHTGSLLRRNSYLRKVGQVYIDAFILAPLVQPDQDRLRLLLRQIADADTHHIWDLRQDLRRSLDSLQASRLKR
jgi:hypothetical protein